MLSLLAATAPGAVTSSTADAGGGLDDGDGGGQPVESFGDAIDTAVTEVQDLLTGIAAAVPRIIIGLVVLIVFWLIARIVVRSVRRRLVSLEGRSAGEITASLVRVAILGIGVFAFLSIAFPSVNAGTLMGGAGVLALAAGFAFQDLLENLMAGILMIFREPFTSGDIVDVDGAEGVVLAITMRETRIRRFDRQVMVVPNAQVYKNAIKIQTESDLIRTELAAGCGYGDDLAHVQEVAERTLAGVDGIADDPAPEVLFTEFGGSSINMGLRYYHAPEQGELRRLQSEVIKAIKVAFDDEGIDIPFPIVTLDSMGAVADAMDAVAEGRATDAAVGRGG